MALLRIDVFFLENTCQIIIGLHGAFILGINLNIKIKLRYQFEVKNLSTKLNIKAKLRYGMTN